MALLVSNDTKTGIRLWVALIWSQMPGSACGGGFTTFRKTGWWQVNDQNTTVLWNVDLRQVHPAGAFFAEQFAGDYRTWGDLGIPFDVLVKRGAAFSQCYDDPTGCDQASRFGVLAFNTAKNMLIILRTKEEGEPAGGSPWEVFVFD
jgi:hypothetical protein